MANKPAVFRQNISLSADLKRRMDKVGDQVNWSAIASAAFEAKLGEIAAAKEKRDMNDLVQRLRAAKADSKSKAWKQGEEAGRDWVENHADADGIMRLERWVEGASDWIDEIESGNVNLADVIRGDDRDSYEANDHDFWQVAFAAISGDRVYYSDEIQASAIKNTDFACGFVNGVMRLWDDVKDQL